MTSLSVYGTYLFRRRLAEGGSLVHVLLCSVILPCVHRRLHAYCHMRLSDFSEGCHTAEQQGNQVRPCVESLATLVSMSFFAAKLTKVRPIKLATWEKRCTVPMEGVF